LSVVRLPNRGGVQAGTTAPPPPQRAAPCTRAARHGGQSAWLPRARVPQRGWAAARRDGSHGRPGTRPRVRRLAASGWRNKAPWAGSVLTFERSGGEPNGHATLRRREKQSSIDLVGAAKGKCAVAAADTRARSESGQRRSVRRWRLVLRLSWAAAAGISYTRNTRSDGGRGGVRCPAGASWKHDCLRSSWRERHLRGDDPAHVSQLDGRRDGRSGCACIG